MLSNKLNNLSILGLLALAACSNQAKQEGATQGTTENAPQNQVQIELNKVEAKAALVAAIAKISSQELPLALVELDKAIKLDPSSHEAFALRAYVGFQLELPDEKVMADLDQCLALKPDFVDAHFYRGGLLFKRLDFPGAYSELEYSRSVYEKDGPADKLQQSKDALSALDQVEGQLITLRDSMAKMEASGLVDNNNPQVAEAREKLSKAKFR